MDILNLSRFAGYILDFFLPRTCVVCEAVLFDDEELLCRKCAGDIPHTYFWLMRNNPMADKFNGLIQEDIVAALDAEAEVRKKGTALERVAPAMGRDTATLSKGNVALGRDSATLGRGERYVYAAALFFYSADSEYRRITQAIKYHGRSDVGRAFGRMLGERLRGSALYADVDAIVPVPLHWMRQWQRGYNQAEIIAGGVAEAMGIPICSDILRRCRRTKTQTRLDINEKARNVKGAFTVAREFIHKGQNGNDTPPTFKHLLLIDDVYTTGSTLHACFLALRTAFPPHIRISIATLGFVGGS